MKNFHHLSANITKWSNTLKQFVSKLPTNCLSVFDHFVGFALKRLIYKLRHVLIKQLLQKQPQYVVIYVGVTRNFEGQRKFTQNLRKSTQTHFKCLAANAKKLLRCVCNHFETFCIKRVKKIYSPRCFIGIHL